MTKFRGKNSAFGAPGIEPRWTQGNKEGIGTAYSSDSQVWFTLWKGCITEVYYPTIDKPQIRDFQFLMTDGSTFFHDEKRNLHSHIEKVSKDSLGYIMVNSDPAGRYKIIKEIITAPHHSCVLQHTRLEGDPKFLSKLRLYALCAPHLEVGGWDNNGYVIELACRQILVAEKNGTWMAMGASVPFSKLSCGYVGQSDGWTDLSTNFIMDWEFDKATEGNIALMGELDLQGKTEFTMGIAFGSGLHSAVTSLFQSLGIPFSKHHRRFIEQWKRTSNIHPELEKHSQDEGNLLRTSKSLLLAHEDKTFAGALIASLSIPW